MSPSIAVALVVGSGGLVAASALRRGGVRGTRLIGYSVGFGPLIGQGMASLQFFYFRALGWRPATTADFLVLLGVLLLILEAGEWAGRARNLSHKSAVARPSWLSLLEMVAFAGASCVAAAVWHAFSDIGSHWPIGSWDAVAIWNLKARLLYHGYDTFPTALQALWPPSLPHYPLMLPGVLAAHYSMLGAESEELARLIGLANVVGVGALLFTVVADRGDRIVAAAALAMFWSALPVWLVGFGQVSDVLLSYAVLGAFVSLASRLEDDPDRAAIPAALGGVCLGYACWTKNEGLVLAVILAFWYFVFDVTRGRRAPWATSCWIAAGALPGALALLHFKTMWVPDGVVGQYLTESWASRLFDLERWRIPTPRDRRLKARSRQTIPSGDHASPAEWC